MKRRLVIIGFIAAIAAIGCRSERDSGDIRSHAGPTPLIDGFNSRQRSSEVEKMIRNTGMTVAVLEKGATDGQQSKLRPPLSIRVLSVTEFSYLGMRGDLRLEFIDDELAATWFYPKDADRFDAEMKKRGSAVEPGSPIRLHAATELRVDVDYRGQKYWAWEDINLRQKVERWIKKYA